MLVSPRAEPGRPEGWLFLAAVVTEHCRLKHLMFGWEERGTFSRLGRCCACPQLCDRGRSTQGWGWHRFEGRSQLCTHPVCRSEWPSGGFSQPFREGLWLLVELVHVWSLSLMQTPSAEPPRLHPWPWCWTEGPSSSRQWHMAVIAGPDIQTPNLQHPICSAMA